MPDFDVSRLDFGACQNADSITAENYKNDVFMYGARPAEYKVAPRSLRAFFGSPHILYGRAFSGVDASQHRTRERLVGLERHDGTWDIMTQRHHPNHDPLAAPNTRSMNKVAGGLTRDEVQAALKVFEAHRKGQPVPAAAKHHRHGSSRR